MFLEKYLNSTYLTLVYNNYDENYLKFLDETKFLRIYMLLKKYGFNFINDIIVKYIEIFEMDEKYVESEILKLKNKLGQNFVYIVGNDMTYLNEIIDNQEFEDD